PLAQETFMLDPSNVALTTTALGIGALGAVIVEVLWWAQGAVNGNRRRLWRPRPETTIGTRSTTDSDEARGHELAGQGQGPIGEELRQGRHCDRQGGRRRRPEDAGQVRRQGRKGAGSGQESRR